MEACRKVGGERVLITSGSNNTRKVVPAIKLGAVDYVKPFRPPRLKRAIRCVLESGNEIHTDALPLSAEDAASVDELEGDLFFLAASPAMKRIRAQAALIARFDVPVLLLGESGVGKEILAQLIHKLSSRASRPLVRVNCAALPTELLESELFGYQAGAFTGATSSRPGKFDLADHGTILLDEIGEMSAAHQAKLLHVLQDGRFSRLGGGTSTQVNARVLAATNVDIGKAISEHKLREDVYHRLNAFTITIPPLRERRQEIPLLLEHYMSNLAAKLGRSPLSLSKRIVEECMRHRWPGNLRELGNFVQRYLILADEGLMVDELQATARNAGRLHSDMSPKPPYTPSNGSLKELVRSLKEVAEAKEIQRVLEETNWNRKLTASRLSISDKALRYKTKEYGITRQDK